MMVGLRFDVDSPCSMQLQSITCCNRTFNVSSWYNTLHGRLLSLDIPDLKILRFIYLSETVELDVTRGFRGERHHDTLLEQIVEALLLDAMSCGFGWALPGPRFGKPIKCRLVSSARIHPVIGMSENRETTQTW